jgi:murein DD-endopeptidase MepM/ murein hydrolase activator NlpD
MDDYSPRARERYEARRRAIEARRRRRSLALGLLAALLLGGGALAVFLLRPSPPAVVVAPTATDAGEATPTEAATSVARATPGGARATAQPPAPGAPTAMAQLLDDRRLSYEPNFYVPQIEALLAERNSPLREVRFQVGDRSHSFAEVLVSQSSLYSVNPKVVLAILELQSGAVTGATPEALRFAAGYRGEGGRLAGLNAQLLWLIRTLHYAQRDYPSYPYLTYADDTSAPPPQALSLAEYALARALAPTVSPGQLGPLLGDGARSFLAVYTRLFEDPRPAHAELPPPAAPFLLRPMEKPFPIASFFDHDAPFLQRNGSLATYWGVDDGDVAYDGHDGWDYAMAAPDLALAAAPGTVVFAGNSDDGCATPARAVIVDHGNGYRTLYWHLYELYVETGEGVVAGTQLGMVGASGCAQGEHLHLQVQYLGRDSDPFGWCGAGADPWALHPAGNHSGWLWADRPSPCEPLPPGAVAVDDAGPGFSTAGEGWEVAQPGYGGATRFAASRVGADPGRPWELRAQELPPVALWEPELPPGRYRVLAHVPFVASGAERLPTFAPFRWSSTAHSQDVRYVVGHAEGQSEVVVDQSLYSNDWADLGTYSFSAGSRPYVALSSLAELRDYTVWADAVVWIPAE